MGHHILTLNDFMVATRGVLSWALQSGLTPSFTTDFDPSAATKSAFNASLSGNGFEYSTNSSVTVTAINCPIAVRVGSITASPAFPVVLYGRATTAGSISSTNLQSGPSENGWIQLNVGDELLADLNTTLGFGVFKIVGDPTATIQFLNASNNNAVLGTHTIT